MIKSPVLLKVLFRVEKFILRHADVVSSISPGMISKVESKCKREVLLFPNWVDTKLFYPIKDKAALKREFNFKSTDTIVLYSGAIGEKQGLDIILHSARALRTVPHLKFIICGTGPYMKHLERMKEDLHLDNLTFRPLQPANLLNRFLNMADIHLVIQKKEASDLVMPSKLTNILAIGGVAIVTASADSSLFKIIEKKKIAYAIEPENRTALTQAISTCLELKNDSISINARLYAEQALSIDKVMFRFSGHMRPGIGANFGGLSVDA